MDIEYLTGDEIDSEVARILGKGIVFESRDLTEMGVEWRRWECDSDHDMLNTDTGYRLRKTSSHDSDIARFSLAQLPGCCGVALYSNVSVGMVYREKLLKLVEFLAKIHSYTTIMATDHLNGAISSVWEDWDLVYAFENRRTKNSCEVRMKRL